MQLVFKLKGWTDVVGPNDIKAPLISDSKTHDDHAHAYIMLHVSKEVFVNVAESSTAHAAWHLLKQIYEPKCNASVLQHLQTFFAMQQGDDSVQNYITKVKSTASMIRDTASKDMIELTDSLISAKLLIGASQKFRNVISAIDVQDSPLTLPGISSILLREEKRQENSEQDTSSLLSSQVSALQSANSALSSQVQKLTVASRARPVDMSKYCSLHRRHGHTDDECFVQHPELRRAKRHNTQDLHHYPRALSANFKHKHSRSKLDWILDSGCSHHMSFDASLLNDYTKNSKCPGIQLGDNSIIETPGQGTMAIDIDGGHQIALDNVLHAPKLERNLMSISQCTSNGLKFWFDADSCTIFPNGGTVPPVGKPLCSVAKGNDNLYRIHRRADSPAQTFFGVRSQACIPKEVWHKRLGHINDRDLQRLHTNNATGIFIAKDSQSSTSRSNRCESCIMSKMARAPFPSSRHNLASRPFEVVFSDICGPFPVPSLAGSRYFISFIDKKTRYAMVYFLKQKSDALDAFKTFDAMAFRRSGQRINAVETLHTDNGGEYLSALFKEFCEKQGIVQETTVPYCPQQNAIAERFNRTMQEIGNSIRHEAGLGREFWAESINTAVYLYVRRPHSALNFITPYEALRQEKPDLSHLRIFGCRAWYRIPAELRRKLSPRAEPAIFIGYSKTQQGYCFWNPIKRRIVVSRDAVFDENTFPAKSPRQDQNETTNFNDIILFSTHGRTIRSDVEIQNESSLAIDDNEQQDNNASEAISAQIPEPASANGSPDRCQSPYDEEEDVFHDVVETIPSDEGKVMRQHELRRSSRSRTQTRPYWLTYPNIGAPAPDPDIEHDAFANVVAIANKIKACDVSVPSTYKQAMHGPNAAYWREAVNKEFSALVQKGTWTQSSLPTGSKAIGCKWVFKVKAHADGSIDKFKARLVIKGFSQRPGIDFNETFAPVAHHTSLRIVIALAATHSLQLHQLDVIGAYLNGNVDEEIYMTLPPECVDSPEQSVVRLRKALYGLKQAGMVWNREIDQFLTTELKFLRSLADPCIYTRNNASDVMLLALYVDDILLAHNNTTLADQIIAQFSAKFDITDLGQPTKLLGMRIHQDISCGTITLDQGYYINESLDRFNMRDCNMVETPHAVGVYLNSSMSPSTPDEITRMKQVPYRELVGSLNYIATMTRPDISTAVGVLCRFGANPGPLHWNAAKRILKYLSGTQTYGIKYSKSTNGCNQVVGYSDSDWAGDPETRRSTSGFVFCLANGPISWNSKRQRAVSTSSVEAEYVALYGATREATWVRQLLAELGFRQEQPTTIFEDNNGCIAISQNRRTDERTKHIDVKYHFTREKVEQGTIVVKPCRTDQMIADSLTKPIDTKKYLWCRQAMGLVDITHIGDKLRGRIETNNVSPAEDLTLPFNIATTSEQCRRHNERELHVG